MMKKKKKILITTMAILLVITPIAIGASFVFASFNSYERDIKNAKRTFERLTLAQKTVDLTNDANQKLPSEIAHSIKSIKALNDLIKGVIIAPNDITYKPQVIDTNDIKGYFEIEIEMKKYKFSDIFKFKVNGFKTITQIQNIIDTALEKIDNDTIKGDKDKLPSAVVVERSILIETLIGFPQTNNDVHFSIIWKSHSDKAGTLTINLKATKGKVNVIKEITISGFKKQTKAPKVTTSSLNDEANKLKKENFHFNKKPLDFKKTASNHINPEKISGAGLSKGTTLVASEGKTLEDKLTITYKLKNGSVTSDEQTITIDGFKKQVVIDLNIKASTLRKDNFYYSSESFDTIKIASNYNDQSQVSLKPSSTPEGVTFVASKLDVGATKITITYTLIKGGNSSDPQTITISGFKKEEVFELNELAKTLSEVDFEYENKAIDKEKTASYYNDFSQVSLKALVTPEDISFVASKLDVGATKITITYTLVEGGKTSDPQTIIIFDFKEEEIFELNELAKTLSEVDFEYDSKDIDKRKINLVYSEYSKISLKPLSIPEGVTFVASKLDVGTTKITITYTLIKEKKVSDPQTTTISGFKEVEIFELNELAKTLSAENFQYNSKDIDKEEAALAYSEYSKISLKPSSIPEGVSFVASKLDVGVTEITITYTLAKGEKISDPQAITISGFKTIKKIEGEINDVKKILEDLDNTTIKDKNKIARTTKYSGQLHNFFLETYLSSPNPKDFKVIKKVTVGVTTNVKSDSVQIVTLTISKIGGTTTIVKLEVIGFKTEIQAQADQKAVEEVKNLIDIESTTTKIFDLPSQVFYDNLDDFKDKTNIGNSLDQVILALKKPDPVKIKITSDNKNKKEQKIVIFTITKGAGEIKHTIVVNGFKTQDEFNVDDFKKILEDMSKNTINTTNKSSLASKVIYNDLIEFINKTSVNGYFIPKIQSFFKVEGLAVKFILSSNDKIGQQNLTFIITKGAKRTEYTITINGFKIQDQFDVDVELDKINQYTTIKGDKSKLPKEIEFVKNLEGFPQKVNGVKFDVKKLMDVDNEKGKLYITLIATKGSVREEKTIIISGFKKYTQIN